MSQGGEILSLVFAHSLRCNLLPTTFYMHTVGASAEISYHQLLFRLQHCEYIQQHCKTMHLSTITNAS